MNKDKTSTSVKLLINFISANSLFPLSALFLADFIIRLPYLTSLQQSVKIANEFDIATAFTSAWLLPMSLASRSLEIESKYNYRKFKAMFFQNIWPVLLAVVILVFLSFATIVILYARLILTEDVYGVVRAIPFSAWPVFLLYLFPNALRFYFLGQPAGAAAGLKALIFTILICTLLYLVALLGSNVLTALSVFLIVSFAFYNANSNSK